MADGKVHMILDITVGTVTFGAEDLPQQTDRKATTDVKVAPGDTIVIGGLRQQEHKVTEVRTPILGSIPYLGRLFRKTLRETHHSVLTILITPRVMGQETPPATLPDPGWTPYEMDDRYKVPIMNNDSLEGKPDRLERLLWGGKDDPEQ
jgi:type II secretory pathway component GspD/PulD (secretin)